MSQRLLNNTKWLWCVLALHAGLNWGQTRSVTVRSPPGSPATVEAQAKFFQYRHFPTTEEFNQGHRLGSERHFTERHERAKPSEGLFSAKVRWGDKKGGYGEHYWDLNHAGHGNHGDDGYDHEPHNDHNDHSDHYDEPNENSHNYGSDDYDPEKSSYEESGRAKRAHPKIKVERKHQKQTETYEEQSRPLKLKRKNKEELQTAATHIDEEYSDDDDDEEEEEEEEPYEKPKPKRQKYKKQEEKQHQSNKQQPKEKNQFVLVVSQKDDSEKQKQQTQPQNPARQSELPQYHLKKQPELPQYAPQKTELPQYVPYEAGAGVRQYQQPEVSAATTVPRLFLEPSTGHVVDRATGQAYVLQPIAPKKYN